MSFRSFLPCTSCNSFNLVLSGHPKSINLILSTERDTCLIQGITTQKFGPMFILLSMETPQVCFPSKIAEFQTAGNGGSSFIGLKIYVYNAQITIETLNKRGGGYNGKKRVGECREGWV